MDRSISSTFAISDQGQEDLRQARPRIDSEMYSEVESSEDFKEPSEKEKRRRHRKKSRDYDSDRRRHSKKKRRKESKSHRRHHSSDSSRSRSRSRSRSHSRSDHRSRRRSPANHSLQYDSENSRDEYSCYSSRPARDARDSECYKFQVPNSTIMVRALALHLGENDIRQDILKCDLLAKDIRLIRQRDTGISRGFAFVEFSSVQDATKWVEARKGILEFDDQSQANMIYSMPKLANSENASKIPLSDWLCSKCQGHNFKRREFCYKCHEPRPNCSHSSQDEADETSLQPTNTIMLGNLDALTTEDSILQAFERQPYLATIPIRSVRIGRDSATNLSLSVCYVETNNVTDATRVFTILNRDPLKVDCREVTASYSKSAGQTVASSSVAATALAAAQWSIHGSQSSKTEAYELDHQDNIEKMAEYSASLYAKTSEEHALYLDYYRDYYQKQEKNQPTTTSASKMEASEKFKEGLATGPGTSMSESKNKPNQVVGITRGFPDISKYQYDETSGYFFDESSSMYYDPKTKYFYDSTTMQFMYWNSDQQIFVPLQVATSAASSQDSVNEEEKPINEEGMPDKDKVAKKIAKDMEKWAKTLNQKKDQKYHSISADDPKLANPEDGLQKESAGRSSIKTPKGQKDNGKHFAETHFSSYVEELDAPYEEKGKTLRIPSSVIDTTKLSCLLCKRKFPTMEVLLKHTELSELHKKNLEALSSSEEFDIPRPSASAPSKYRDRAKERRSCFGIDKGEPRNSLKDMYLESKRKKTESIVEQPTRDGIREDNVGNRMLKSMGWREGQGLGKGNQGMVDIITTQARASNLGLGLKSSLDNEDRYSKARKVTLARYKELDQC